ncbi:hypothetical protein C0J52_26867 [Blattella germanica]|nr:hypothetical protein C0J52_26867 [Blattella germanica]
MGLLRNMPGGLLQREPPDHNRKGIMQLALLAPYNNLASSVAAALVPTLLTPKIRITDENDRTFSYGSDSNSQPTDPNQQSNNQEQGSRRSSLASRRGSEIGSLAGSRRGSEVSRRGSEVSRRGSEADGISGLFLGSDINRSRRGSESSSCSQNRHLDLARRGSNCSSLADIAEDEIRSMPQEDLPPSPVSPTSASARKKSLSWQKSNPSEPIASSSKEPRRSKVQINCGDQSEDEVTAETSLLPRQNEPHTEDKGSSDLTLHSILNHIAYVNRAALPNQNVGGTAPTSRKSQVQRVLNATYITALLGVILCLFDAGRLCGPYGLLATSRGATAPGTELRPWPWFCFQTICRLLEFAMGCAMANITKQPVNSRHQYLQQQYAYSLRLKQHRESLYI